MRLGAVRAAVIARWAAAKVGAGPSYGGEGAFALPADHVAGLRVPAGGSSCANCRFLEAKDDGPHCAEENFVRWNGGETKLPVTDPATYCSDWWRGAQ